MSVVEIKTPLTKEKVKNLRAGDVVKITGTIYTARDAAHKKMMKTIENNESIPFDVENAIVYYAGPSPERPGKLVGSIGPTTSYRMDEMTVPLLKLGLTGMIGKGLRSEQVIQGMIEYGAVYFAAIGGAGALLSSCVKQVEIIAYEELGAEAIRKLEVVEFPAIVAIDSLGNSLYERD